MIQVYLCSMCGTIPLKNGPMHGNGPVFPLLGEKGILTVISCEKCFPHAKAHSRLSRRDHGVSVCVVHLLAPPTALAFCFRLALHACLRDFRTCRRRSTRSSRERVRGRTRRQPGERGEGARN